METKNKRGTKNIENHLNMGSSKTEGNLLVTSQNQRMYKENDH